MAPADQCGGQPGKRLRPVLGGEAIGLVRQDHQVGAAGGEFVAGGARAAIAAVSGFLVPPIRTASRPAGWLHQSVTPTSSSGAPAATASVREGTSDTTRRVGPLRVIPPPYARGQLPPQERAVVLRR